MSGSAVMIKIGLENLFACLRTLDLIFVQTRFNQIGNSSALPPFAKLKNFLFVCVVADVKLVVVTFLEWRVQDLIYDPVH